MNQILELRKMELGNAEEFLTSKGWEFLDASEPSFEKSGTVTFTYLKDETSSVAQSFLTYIYNIWGMKRIHIQVSENDKYINYINTIKGFGCKMISSYVEDGALVKIYQGSTTTFIIESSTSENLYNEDSATWTFFILSNDDYDELFGEDE
jgi:hypothetical protein